MAKKREKHEKESVEPTIKVYDVADKASRAADAGFTDAYSYKSTLNLCMKDKPSVTPELFFLLVAIILLVVLFVEYLGIYRPYRAVEQAEARLEADRATLQETLDRIGDYYDVQQQYREYNYENYDRTIADRPEILALLEEIVFPAGKVTSMTLSGNTLNLAVIEVPLSAYSKLQADLIKRTDLVGEVTVSMTGYDDRTDVPTLNLTIVFINTTGEGDNT